MADLYNETKSTSITGLVSLHDVQGLNRVENTALDGTYYMQIIGDPRVTYELTAYLKSSTIKTALLDAEADGDLLSVEVARGTFYGRIVSCKVDKIKSELYKATIVLAKEDT